MTQTQTHTAEAGDVTTLRGAGEVPAVGTEDRDFWLEAAVQHGFEETAGGEHLAEYDPPAYFATEDEVLALMASCRAQGRKDALAASPAPRASAAVPEELRQARAAIAEALGLFASAIKSGETWSPTCEIVKIAAYSALDTLAAAPAAPPADGGTEAVKAWVKSHPAAVQFLGSPMWSYSAVIDAFLAGVALAARAEGAGDSVAEPDPVMKPGQGPLDTQASSRTPAGAAGDPVGEALRKLPEDGYAPFDVPAHIKLHLYDLQLIERKIGGTYALTDKGRAALANRPASPAPAALADVKEVAELRKFADYVLMWCDRGLPHGGPGNEKTALDAIRWHPALRSRRETLATQPASSVPPASAGQCEIDYVRLIPWEIGEHGVEIVMASGRRVLLPLRSSTALAPAAQVNPGREEIARIIDPDAWDETTNGYGSWRSGSARVTSLTKADAILAARPGAVGDAGDRYSVSKDKHRQRIQWIGAAISRRDWSAVEQAHAAIRDAFDRPDIYDPPAPATRPAPSPAKGGN